MVVVDDGTDVQTREICKAYSRSGTASRRISRVRSNLVYLKPYRPSVVFRNPSIPNNIGIRQAKGDIIILQNAECRHQDPNAIQKLASRVTDSNAVFARVTSLNQDGIKGSLYCGKENPRPYFFCGAIKKSWFERLRGFDEDYTGAGFDDDDFADRLKAAGVSFEFTDIEVYHQWHPPVLGMADFSPMQTLYNQKKLAMEAGSIGIERNLGKEWGRV